jgi:hypothetical protein
MELLDENVKYIFSILKKIGIPIKRWRLDNHNLVVVDTIDLPCSIEHLVSIMDGTRT